jgi:hypothetical protein
MQSISLAQNNEPRNKLKRLGLGHQWRAWEPGFRTEGL